MHRTDWGRPAGIVGAQLVTRILMTVATAVGPSARGAGRRLVWLKVRCRFDFAWVIIGATVTTALGSGNPAHGSPEQDAQRKILNDFIRSSSVFDGVADVDRLDPTTGGMRVEFVPESPPAVPATSCTRTARDTKRWRPPSTPRH
jgi:hypothetical protein